MLTIGELAPDFELPNQDGKNVRLSDFRGKKVVLFAFPHANTMGCNNQACGFRDEFEEFRTHNAVVLGISCDPQAVLQEWKANKNLPYDLLSDTTHEVVQAWGAWGIPMFGIIKVPMINRSYWVIDEDGVLIDQQINVLPGTSVKKALEAVERVITPTTTG
ncbi:MAG: peroxiredoxin [Anaerolinea sp.]|nr:peroxiredoxin [Anaerolinea sp.]